jgi:HTH-type transcriptional regulator/antitoxin HipB
MQSTPQQIGELVKATRKQMGVTQRDLALTSGTGLRFIIELEKGKPTCQLGKVLTVLHTLGIKLEFHAPLEGRSGAASPPRKPARSRRDAGQPHVGGS